MSQVCKLYASREPCGTDMAYLRYPFRRDEARGLHNRQARRSKPANELHFHRGRDSRLLILQTVSRPYFYDLHIAGQAPQQLQEFPPSTSETVHSEESLTHLHYRNIIDTLEEEITLGRKRFNPSALQFSESSSSCDDIQRLPLPFATLWCRLPPFLGARTRDMSGADDFVPT
jgi:hypothetical protein